MDPRAKRNYRLLIPLLLAIVAMLLSSTLGIPSSVAYAEGGQPPAPNGITSTDYLTLKTITTADGTSLTDSIIDGPPVPPPGTELQRTAVEIMPQSVKILTVPAFTWVHGCSAVSSAMIAGFYDRNGYPKMYLGPTAGGVMPLTDSAWPLWSDGSSTYPNNPLIASHNGVDGRTTRGTLDDYWRYYGSTAQDPFIGNWVQHTWGTAIGDYMKTSQSQYGNTDGSTNFFNYTSGATKLTCSAMTTFTYQGRKISLLDGTYGRKLFYEARGYKVTDCYSQSTDNKAGGGFSLANFRAQIDAKHPVLLNLAGHSIVGVGYDSASKIIYIHDTWDNKNHTMTWGGSYAGMQLLSVSIVNLGPPPAIVTPTPLLPAGSITDQTPTFTWTKVTGATQYQFFVYTSGVLKYSKMIPAAACGAVAGRCSNTPAAPLSFGAHTWKVRALIGGIWKPYSVVKGFLITP